MAIFFYLFENKNRIEVYCLGIYQDEKEDGFTLTKAAQSFQSQEVSGLSNLITRYELFFVVTFLS